MATEESGASTLKHLLERRRAESPDAPAYAFIDERLNCTRLLTRASLQREAESLASTLRCAAPRGERALLLFPDGPGAVIAFWACMLAELIAVPAPAPEAGRMKTAVPRLEGIAKDCEPALVLAPSEVVEATRRVDTSFLNPARCIVVDDAAPDSPPCARHEAMQAEDLGVDDAPAYLQYTSGSTTTPRGVVIRHRNVLANCAAMAAASGTTSSSRMLSWLPYFHDYGLVSGIIAPLYAGIPAWLMKPSSFLRRPLSWLEAIERFSITHTGAPAFAYAACTRALRRTPGWRGDLSRLQFASCGAEPIDARVVDEFLDAFRPYGFEKAAFSPAYGLAEATLAVTMSSAGSHTTLDVDAEALRRGQVVAGRQTGPPDVRLRRIVGCGTALDGLDVVVVSPDTLTPADPGTVGEVWVAGPSVAKGYWKATAEVADLPSAFGHHLAGHEGEFLRTGDLGFTAKGNLFITGRRKDLLIISGRNVHPQDVEWTVERALAAMSDDGAERRPDHRAGHCAVFSIEHDGEEQAVVVHEVRRGADSRRLHSLARAIRKAVAEEHDLALREVAFVAPGSIPRTSSGKVRRQECRRAYLDGTLDPLLADGRSASASATGLVPVLSGIEETLRRIWADVLGTGDFDADDDFFALGGHSLTATQAAARIRERMGVEVPLATLFEARTIRSLARALELLGHVREHACEPVQVIPTVPRTSAMPVSFSQRRMWLLQQLTPDSTAYNMPFALRLRGPLNEPALLDAIESLVQRHEAFRTTLHAGTDGEPVQRIASSVTLPLVRADLRGGAQADREERARRLLREEAMRPFDLAAGPLFRVILVDMGPDDRLMMWLLHHAIGDQWSGGILSRELHWLYRARLKGDAAKLPPLPFEYADYAAWQRRHWTEQALDEQLAFWRNRLAGLAPLALPSDHPRPPRPAFRGSHVSVALRDSTLAAVRRLSTEHAATPFMTLLACFMLLLRRCTGSSDIAVGVPIANRTRLAAENVVGTLVNTLVMRTQVDPGLTFAALLAHVRETALEAYAHQDLPFERLVEACGEPREAAVPPLVQVLFNVPNAPMTDLALEGLDVELFEFDRGSAQFDLSLTVDTERFHRVYLEYSADLFEQQTAERLLQHFTHLLDQVIRDPRRPLADYDPLTADERERILFDWNRNTRPCPAQRTDELIAAQARRTPSAVALAMDSCQLTYAELDAQAERLAAHLRREGAAPGQRVGVCMQRSVGMVTALLAIMKAGAAYVPLDPAFPRARLQQMIGDAAPRIVLADPAGRAALPDGVPGIVDANALADGPLPGPGHPQDGSHASGGAQAAGADDIAYVIYTSGSTGAPKGVEVPHRALTNFLCAMLEEPGCASTDVLLSVTTLSFDISGLELYLPLVAGGRVEIASREEVADGRLLIERMERCRPTLMQATPATWRMLIESGWRGHAALTVLCGGDSLSPDLAKELLARARAVWNLYGPTETTIWSTASRIENAELPVTIGRPIANTVTYILDEQRQPQPVGTPGELWIGGDGVARGYRNRPDLTAERFLPDPFRGRGVMYRTGDRARFLPDGRIVHMGRLDHQVKVRGFRIEPGEIEACLAKHPLVRHAAVTVRSAPSGESQLLGYAVCVRGADVNPESLRDFLRGRLPDYMIPSRIVVLDALPVTPNNKVDVRALPDPPSMDAGGRAEAAEPRHPLEVQVLALWRQVLGNDGVAMHDNFFDSGGHSLKAVVLLSQIERITGKRLPLATLFEAPTPAGIAAILAAQDWRPPWRSLVAIQPGGAGAPVFAVPGVGGNVLVFSTLSRLLGRQQPFYGLQAQGLDGTSRPFQRIGDMAAHYLREIRQARPAGPYWILGTCTGGVIAYEMAQRLVAEGEQVCLTLVESWHPSSYYPGSVSYATLWPVVAGWSRVSRYRTEMQALRLKEWPGFFHRKARNMGRAVWGAAGIGSSEAPFQEERVVRATLQAVALYRPRPYPGRLLNVVAMDRQIPDGALDTRRRWEALAAESVSISIEAEDSGRLFVSPHVEELAAHLAAYAAAAFSEKPASIESSVHAAAAGTA